MRGRKRADHWGQKSDLRFEKADIRRERIVSADYAD